MSLLEEKQHNLELLSSYKLGENIRNFVFSIEKDFKFLPGQFLIFKLKLKNNEEISRSYSIASPHLKAGEIEFCIKKVNEGSGLIFDLKKGDKITATGPFGKFIVSKSDSEKIFITVGTGVAPFRAMIPDILNKTKQKVTLIAGFRFERLTLYSDEWRTLESEFENFKYFEVISKPEKNKTKQKGHVQDILKNFLKEDNSKKEFYLCGVGEMIKSVSKLLKQQGVLDNQIFFERYS